MDYPVKTSSQLRPLLVGFRKAAGLTQADMAARLGVTQQTYAQLEAKPEATSMERFFKALRLLKVDVVLSRAADSGSEPEPETGQPAKRVRTTTVKTTTKAPTTKSAGAPARTKTNAKPGAKAQSRKAARSASPETSASRGKGNKTPAATAPASRTQKREDW